MGKNRKQTTTQTLDPQTLAYLDAYRKRAMGGATPGMGQQAFSEDLGFGRQTGAQGIEGYMNPYEKDVIGGINEDFDRQQAMGATAAQQEATKAGAYGGSRAAILKANVTGDINRNRAATISGVRQQGYSNALQALMADRARRANLGFGGYQTGLSGLTPGLMSGTNTTETQMPYNDFKDFLGNLTQLGGAALIR